MLRLTALYIAGASGIARMKPSPDAVRRILTSEDSATTIASVPPQLTCTGVPQQISWRKYEPSLAAASERARLNPILIA
jgi:hypothetical protein